MIDVCDRIFIKNNFQGGGGGGGGGEGGGVVRQKNKKKKGGGGLLFGTGEYMKTVYCVRENRFLSKALCIYFLNVSYSRNGYYRQCMQPSQKYTLHKDLLNNSLVLMS